MLDASGYKQLLELLELFSQIWPILLGTLTVAVIVYGVYRYKLPLVPWLFDIRQKHEDYLKKKEQQTFKRRVLEVHLRLGNSFIDIHEIAAARNQFEKAAKIDPLSIDAQIGLIKADVFETAINTESNPEISIKRIEAIGCESQNDKHVHIFLGEVLMRVDYDQAYEEFDKALAIDPNLAFAYQSKGFINGIRGKVSEAIIEFRHAAEISPMNIYVLNNLGYYLYLEKKFEEAISVFERAILIDKKICVTLSSLSTTYRVTGNLKRPLQLQRKLAALINDPETCSMPRNKVWWNYNIAGENVILSDIEQKKYYVLMELAYTLSLDNKQEESEHYLNMARSVQVYDTTPAQKLIMFNHRELSALQPQFARSSEEFIGKVMPPKEGMQG